MGLDTKIEWASAGLPRGASWNPIRARNKTTGKVGWHCTHVTAGCQNCYAEGMNKRLGTGLPYKPGHEKDIEIFLDEKILLQPMKWREPRGIFVGSMTDAFADFVPDDMLDKMHAVAALAPQHRFLWLTKRPKRMLEYLTHPMAYSRVLRAASTLRAWRPALGDIPISNPADAAFWPHVWRGVSAEDQATADERIPDLIETPATVRFCSYEPALGPIDFEAMPFPDGDPRHKWSALTGQALMYADGVGCPPFTVRMDKPIRGKLDLVICGGESGPHARPMHPDWARSARDQCAAASVAYFFKQWGQWLPGENFGWPLARWQDGETGKHSLGERLPDGSWRHFGEPGTLGAFALRVGKARAGRLLDGREWNQMPELRQ